MAASRIQAVGKLSGNPTVWLIFYTVIVTSVMYVAYQGYVIKYPGNDPKGVQGTLLGVDDWPDQRLSIHWDIVVLHGQVQAALETLGLFTGWILGRWRRNALRILPPGLLNPFLPFLVVFMIILLVVK